MGFLTAIVGVQDELGQRLDQPTSDGTRAPILLELGDEFETESREEGGFTVLKILLAGGGDAEPTFDVTAIKANTNYTPAFNELVRYNPDSGGPVTITLPTAVGNAGRRITIKNVTASGVSINLATTSSQTIDGAAPGTFSGAYGSRTFVSDGANWMVV